MWDLINHVANNEVLPLFKVGVADAARTYLKRQNSLEPLAKAVRPHMVLGMA